MQRRYSKPGRAALAFACAMAWAAAGVAREPAPGHRDAELQQCFDMNDLSHWTATPDGRSIYLRIAWNRVYRLDFRSGCPGASGIDMHLVTTVHGTTSVCAPLDLDLKVADSQGFGVRCLVSGITQLTPAEVAALPAKLRP